MARQKCPVTPRPIMSAEQLQELERQYEALNGVANPQQEQRDVWGLVGVCKSQAHIFVQS